MKRGRPRKHKTWFPDAGRSAKSVTFRLDPALLKRVQRHSDNQSITRTEIIERAVEKFLDSVGA